MSSISDLRAKMKSMMIETESESSSSDRYWNITVDSAGNGSAVIRFLPSKDLTKSPYATTYTHWFTHPVTGKTYDAMSSSTFSKTGQDPMGEFNSWLWKKGEEDKVRSQKRQTKIYVNILVVKDPAKPENEGKVMIYRMGTKILDKIKAQLTPEFEEEPCNVFDIFSGKNLRLKCKNVSNYRNYDDSSFVDKVTAIAETDEEIERIYNQVYDVHQMFLDPTKNKSDDEKLQLMQGVFGRDPLFLEWMSATGKDVDVTPTKKAAPAISDDDDDIPPFDVEPKKAAKVEAKAPPKPSSSDSDIDDILSELGL